MSVDPPIDHPLHRIPQVHADDPVATKTEWTPLVKGGANFRTHRLKQTSYNSYASVATTASHVFNSIITLLGLGALAGTYFIGKESLLGAAIVLIVGSVFTAVGLFLTRRAMAPFTIDLDRMVYYKGRHYDPHQVADETVFGSLKRVHALQIIPERIRMEDTSSSYLSYELNLVLDNGSRINLMDHGRLERLQEDAATLSQVLQVPVWDGS